MCPMKKVSDNGDIVKRAQILIYSNQYGEGSIEDLKSLVLPNTNHDIIPSVVTKDQLILTYGSFMLASLGIRKSNAISQRMRITNGLMRKVADKQRVYVLEAKIF